MKLPSIRQIATDSGRAFRRFPLVVADAAIGTMSALILIDREGPHKPTILFNTLFAAIAGIPLLIALALTAEKRKWKRPISAAVTALGVCALAAYAWTVPSDPLEGPSVHLLRLL